MRSELDSGVTYNMCRHHEVNFDENLKSRETQRVSSRLLKMSELLTAVKRGELKYVRKVFLTLQADEVARLITYRAPETKETLLFCACVTGSYEMVRLLLAKGRGVCGLYTAWGAGPLHAASERGHEAVVRLLLKHRADINVQTSYGDTALHLAAYRGHYGVVRCLVEAGCKLAIRNSKRKTALDDAETARHYRIVQYLSSVMQLDVERAKSSEEFGKADTENKMVNNKFDGLMTTQPLANYSPQQRLDRSISWTCSSNTSWNFHDDQCSTFSTDSEGMTDELGMGDNVSLSRCLMGQGLDQIPESRSLTEIRRQGATFPRASSPRDGAVEQRTWGRRCSDTTHSRVKYLESLVEGLQRGLMETQQELEKTKNELKHAKDMPWSSGQMNIDRSSDDTAELILRLHKRVPCQPN